MKKTILLLCFVITLTTALTACGVDDSTVTTPSESNELSGEITFSTWGSVQEKEVNEQIIALFEEKHPGVKVNLEYIPQEYTTKIDTMFLGGNAPDVIYGHPRYFTRWASDGLLMDLTDKFNQTPELLDDSIYKTNLYEAFKYNGKHFATVNGECSLVLYYNKDLFDSAGIEYPTNEWTWSDLIAAAKQLTIFDENGHPQQFGISIGSWYPLVQAYQFSHGGRWYDDMNDPTKVTFNSPETIEALQLMQDLIHKYNVAPTSSNQDVLGGNFDTGKIAMDITGAWAVVYRSDIDSFNWDIAHIPLADNGAPRSVSRLYAGYAISKTTKNPDLAWEFAKFMQSEEAQNLLASTGLITVIHREISTSDEVLNFEGAPENHIVRVEATDYSIHNDALLPNWEETLERYVNPNIQLLLNNEQDAETTAKKIHEGLEIMLKQIDK